MQTPRALALASLLVSLIPIGSARADIAYTVVDLGTLGGTSSVATNVGTQGANTSGMIVGESATTDNAQHAFLYLNGQMFDLNTLCDLSQSDFRVLVVAKSISDSCLITGEGITNNGEKHAFMLTPIAVEGGRWSYQCCQWVWIPQGEIGWWWEENCGCYRWHGPPGKHPPCPPNNPPCWRLPLPCPPPCRRPSPTPTPPPGRTPTPTPTYPPRQTPTPTYPPRETPTPGNPNGSPVGVLPTPTPNNPVGIPVGVLPTPTPTYHAVPLGVEPTPTPHYSGRTSGVKSSSTSKGSRAHPTGTASGKTSTSSHASQSSSRNRGSSSVRKHATPKPTPGKP